jgi:hypothetical protein
MTGDELWRVDLGGIGTTSPVVAGGVIYVGGAESDGTRGFLAAVGTAGDASSPTS